MLRSRRARGYALLVLLFVLNGLAYAIFEGFTPAGLTMMFGTPVAFLIIWGVVVLATKWVAKGED